MTEAPSFQHTPYDGSSQPFTVGLRPFTAATWLEPDPFLIAHLSEKEQLFKESRATVFRAEPDTEAAQQEVLDLVAASLRHHHGDSHRVGVESVELLETGRSVPLNGEPALLSAARLIQEDLVVMRPGVDGYRLAAAALCFPSSWSLAEKFSQSMWGIHENVPGFNGGRMGQMVARIFENLKPDQILGRFNWSIYPDGELHHPSPKRIDLNTDESALAQLFLRVERQTLRRLPGSGDILFTIKIHHDPLAALTGQSDREDLAAGLHRQLLALDDEQLRYKGLVASRDALAEALMELGGAVS